MGNITSMCRRSQKELTLLMIGLDNAGKTCTTKHLLGESNDSVVPTVGFSSATLRHSKFNVTIYDLGGGSKIRSIWKNYYALVYGVIFVVDGTAGERMEECKEVIHAVLQDEHISGKPVLLLVNKQDVEGAMDETEVCSMLDLETIISAQKCPTRVENTSAAPKTEGTKLKKDPAIEKGFHWIIGHIEKHFNELHERVQKDIQEQQAQEEKEKAERLERVKKIREERENQLKVDQDASTLNGDCSKNDEEEDIVIGNPFRPISQIKKEIEDKEREDARQQVKTPDGARIINVSPVLGSDEVINMSEVDTVPLEENQQVVECIVHHNSSSSDTKEPAKTGSEMGSDEFADESVGSITDSTEEDTKKKKKVKKKKAFTNKVLPLGDGQNGVVSISEGGLPPIKSRRPSQNSWLDKDEKIDLNSTMDLSALIKHKQFSLEDYTPFVNSSQPDIKASVKSQVGSSATGSTSNGFILPSNIVNNVSHAIGPDLSSNGKEETHGKATVTLLENGDQNDTTKLRENGTANGRPYSGHQQLAEVVI